MSKEKSTTPPPSPFPYMARPGQLQYLMMEAMASAVYYTTAFYLLPFRAFVTVSRPEKSDEA